MKPFILFILPVLFLSCAPGGLKETAASQSDKPGPRPVEAVIAEKRKIRPEIESFGSISFATKTDITPPVEGIVRNIYVNEGDRVGNNTRLARIENLQLQIQAKQIEMNIRRAEAALSLAEAEYWEGKLQTDANLISIEKLSRSITQQEQELQQQEEELADKERLYKIGGISDDEMKKLRLSYQSALTEYSNALQELEIKKIGFRDEDIRARKLEVPADPETRKEIIREINNLSLQAKIEVAKTNLTSAGAELESVNLLLSELDVRSPSEGVVGSKYLEEGERISPGTKLFTLFTDDTVHAVFPVQERELQFLKTGQSVKITVPALEDTEYLGVVKLISPTVDPQSGNAMVKAAVSNPNADLKPGMFVRVKLIYGSAVEKIFIPETCIITRRENTGEIFKLLNNRVFKHSVTLGAQKNEEIEIESGIEEGDLIINSPAPAMQEGEYIEVIP